MKRILAVFLLVVMVLSLTACAGDSEIISNSIPDTISSSSDDGISSDSESTSAEKEKTESVPSSTSETVSDTTNNTMTQTLKPITTQSSTTAQTTQSTAIQSSTTAQTAEPTTTQPQQQNQPPEAVAMPSSTTAEASEPTESAPRILVAFFSRTGENYGVGIIEKGNTHIIADMIAEDVGADSFEIVRVTPYPEEYRACTNEAQNEKSANARPDLTATVDNFGDYDTIFLGYPNWWGDMPMPVYTFLESYDFSGKTVIPFCTHAGSGLSGTVQTLRNKLSEATVLDGLAIPGTTAQNDQITAKQAVLDWLSGLEIN